MNKKLIVLSILGLTAATSALANNAASLSKHCPTVGQITRDFDGRTTEQYRLVATNSDRAQFKSTCQPGAQDCGFNNTYKSDLVNGKYVQLRPAKLINDSTTYQQISKALTCKYSAVDVHGKKLTVPLVNVGNY